MIDKPSQKSGLVIKIERSAKNNGWILTDGCSSVECTDLADFVFSLEKMLTIEIQKLRSDLFFMHAAAVSSNGRCTIIVGESGAGKSTLCLDLCAQKYNYMSDELAPIDPSTGRVYAYPHAICLKAEPDSSIVERRNCLYTSGTIHVPINEVPAYINNHSSLLKNIVFLVRNESSQVAEAAPISKGEAATRLYSNGLNQLAHANDGLTTAARIASMGRNFLLNRGTRKSNLSAVKAIIEN